MNEEYEKRIALVHRVIVLDGDMPKEYAILVTNRSLIFIRQKKTRSDFVLRYETKIGTALVTDVEPRTLKDYERTSFESLASDPANINVPIHSIISLELKADEFQKRRRDFFLWFVMKRQKEVFQVYNFEIIYGQETRLKFYAVPLGAYFKPRRQVQNRETILREYAIELLEIFSKILPADAKVLSVLPYFFARMQKIER